MIIAWKRVCRSELVQVNLEQNIILTQATKRRFLPAAAEEPYVCFDNCSFAIRFRDLGELIPIAGLVFSVTVLFLPESVDRLENLPPDIWVSAAHYLHNTLSGSY